MGTHNSLIGEIEHYGKWSMLPKLPALVKEGSPEGRGWFVWVMEVPISSYHPGLRPPLLK